MGPQPGSSSHTRAGSLHKPTAQPEERKPETAAARLERREQLKKASTLPTSVTGREGRPVSVLKDLLLSARFISPRIMTQHLRHFRAEAVSNPLRKL